MQRITELSFLSEYRVFLRFADGRSGVVDLRPFLGKGIAKALLEPDKYGTLNRFSL